ncbi:MAG: hypothetical protein BGO74_12385 [Burkholderiales bacterium 68-12]|nr:MAG: hypothetical protein BGO74_12385 [Burkholderiales bacterium 68-12]
MNEASASLPQDLASVGGGGAPASSPGALLRAAREASGMHIEALAVALKVPVSRLRALESDDYAALPDAVFARALAASLCRSLKIDAAPVLALMPTSKAPRLEPEVTPVNAAFRDGSEPSRWQPVAGLLRRPVTLAVATLLAAAALLFFSPGLVVEMAGLIRTSGAPEKPVAQSAPVQSGAPALDSAAQAAVAQAPAASEGAASVAVLSAEPVAAVPAPEALAAPAAAAPSGEALSPGADDLLVVRARGPSWVQVRDATGATILQRIVEAGEGVKVQGKPPYAVVIGKADVTEVFVRGQRFDLAAVARENVARFEVKP